MEARKSLSLGNKLTYGVGNFSMQFVMTFVGSFVLIFLTDTIGLQSGIVGTLMAVSMVLDGITDVIFGAIVDKTHTKWGKARPWILWGAIPLAVCEVLLFMLPKSASTAMQYAYFFVFYTLLNAVFYTIVAVSYSTLSALITKNGDERVQIGVISFIFNFVAAMLIPSITTQLVRVLGGGVTGWRLVALIFAVIAALGLFVTALTAKELPEEAHSTQKPVEKIRFRDNYKYLLRNRYFIFMLIAMIVFTMNSVCFTSTGTYFAKYVLNNENMLSVLTMTTMMPMIASLVITPFISKKIGLFRTNAIGFVISFAFSILALILAFAGLYIPMIVCFVLRSLFMGPFAGTQNAIVGNICDYSYLKDGVHIDGTLFSCVSMGTKVGSSLSTAVIGWLLQLGGYVGTAATQSPGALRMITIVYVGLPVIYAGINALLLCNMNVEKANQELREQAEHTA